MKRDHDPAGKWVVWFALWVVLFILGLALAGVATLTGYNTQGWGSTLKITALVSGVLSTLAAVVGDPGEQEE